MASAAVGLEVSPELMDAEVTCLAGPKGRHDPARTAKRHGIDDGAVTLRGRRLPVRRPRVRSVGQDEREVPLESYDTFASTDLLADGIVARMLAGLSTRRYEARARRRNSRRADKRHVQVGGLPPVPHRHRRKAGRVARPPVGRPAVDHHLHRRVRHG